MADITSNLALHWKFDDGNGSSAVDSSGNSLTGTLNNSPLWTVNGRINKALVFNGSNSNVSLGSYTVPTTGTVAFWCRPARAYNSGVSEVLFNHGGSTVLHAQHWTDNHLYIGFLNGTDYRVNVTLSAATWAQNTWQHYALTWVANGNTSFYRNSSAVGSPVGSTNSTLIAGTLRVGSNDVQAAGFSGTIDDVRIYSRALSADDVAALYQYPFFGGVHRTPSGRSSRRRMWG